MISVWHLQYFCTTLSSQMWKQKDVTCCQCRWPKIAISSSQVFKNHSQLRSKTCTGIQNNRKQRKLTNVMLVSLSFPLPYDPATANTITTMAYIVAVTAEQIPGATCQISVHTRSTHLPTQLLNANYTTLNSDSKLASLPWWLHWALMASTVARSHCKWSKPSLFLMQHFTVATKNCNSEFK